MSIPDSVNLSAPSGRWSAARRPLRDCLLRQLLASGAAALVAGTLAAIAALVDGRTPGLSALLRVAVPTGSLLGAALAVTQWRAEAGDVALGALGLPPRLVLVPTALLAAGLALLVPGRPPAAPRGQAPLLEVTPQALRYHNPVDGSALTLEFTPTGAIRREQRPGSPSSPPPAEVWAALPPPTGRTADAPPPPCLPGWALMAPLLVFGLSRGPAAPGLARALAASIASLGAGWWVGG